MFFAPSYSAASPGRASWVGHGFEVVQTDNEELIIVGVLKVYWPDVNAKFDERDILKHIHDLGDILEVGLQTGLKVGIEYIIVSMKGFDVLRKLRIVQMQSRGVHLSACKNVLELLKVAYDAILGAYFSYRNTFAYGSNYILSTLAALRV